MPGYFSLNARPMRSAVSVSPCAMYHVSVPSCLAAACIAARSARAGRGINAVAPMAATPAVKNRRVMICIRSAPESVPPLFNHFGYALGDLCVGQADQLDLGQSLRPFHRRRIGAHRLQMPFDAGLRIVLAQQPFKEQP